MCECMLIHAALFDILQHCPCQSDWRAHSRGDDELLATIGFACCTNGIACTLLSQVTGQVTPNIASFGFN